MKVGTTSSSSVPLAVALWPHDSDSDAPDTPVSLRQDPSSFEGELPVALRGESLLG
jgi:hypothetical protein